MSRRIAYVFAIAGCAVFVVPASADRECFENTCRMPEVIETPDAPAEALEQPVITDATRSAAPRADAVPVMAPAPVPAPTAASAPPPAPIRPQMVVDQLPPPALKPLPFAPHEPVRQAKRPPTRQVEIPKVRQAEAPHEPVEVANRAYSSAGSEPVYAASSYVQPSANVIVVTPGYSYGDDGVVMAHKRNDPSWKLCQTERSRHDDTCSPYQYHAFGAHGYRPLGSYRVQRAAPAYVYIPDAKIVTVVD